jgi:hypothetical protein
VAPFTAYRSRPMDQSSRLRLGRTRKKKLMPWSRSRVRNHSRHPCPCLQPTLPPVETLIGQEESNARNRLAFSPRPSCQFKAVNDSRRARDLGQDGQRNTYHITRRSGVLYMWSFDHPPPPDAAQVLDPGAVLPAEFGTIPLECICCWTTLRGCKYRHIHTDIGMVIIAPY